MRVVGIDPGTRRVGVAVSDSAGRVATPHGVFVPTGDGTVDRVSLVAVITGLGAEHVVVGLPLSLDGGSGPAARWAIEEADALRGLLDVPVDLHDERLTTVAARRAPVLNRRRSAARKPVDGQAAAIMLQSWLDGRSHRSPVPDLPRPDSRPVAGGAGTSVASKRQGTTP